MKPYKIIITGVGICGKSNLAHKLESDLKQNELTVQNSDVDYDPNWRAIKADSDVYLLQTPHGTKSEIIDGINFRDYDKILYVETDPDTYCRLLTTRGLAWFRKGVVEATEDKNPKPRSTEKLEGILEKIAGYAIRMPELLLQDRETFQRLNARFLGTTIKNERELDYGRYEEVLTEIIEGVKQNGK